MALEAYKARKDLAGDFDYWTDPDCPSFMIIRYDDEAGEPTQFALDLGGEIIETEIESLEAAHARMRELHSAMIDDEVRAAERRAGWDPNP
jgi:hypothetical protein